MATQRSGLLYDINRRVNPPTRMVKRFEDGSWVKADGSKGGGTIKYKGYSVVKRGSWNFDEPKHRQMRIQIVRKFKEQPWELKPENRR